MQERATKVSHGNTARQAIDYGDDVLGKLCGAIASDESRHEIAYTRIVDEFFRCLVWRVVAAVLCLLCVKGLSCLAPRASASFVVRYAFPMRSRSWGGGYVVGWVGERGCRQLRRLG